jgi:hypothetical protein
MGEGKGVGARRALGAQGAGSAVCGSSCPAAQTGTGAKKKGAIPHQYDEGVNGETARHGRVSTLVAEAS